MIPAIWHYWPFDGWIPLSNTSNAKSIPMARLPAELFNYQGMWYLNFHSPVCDFGEFLWLTICPWNWWWQYIPLHRFVMTRRFQVEIVISFLQYIGYETFVKWGYATSTNEQIHRSRWPRLIDVDYICSHNHWPLMVLSIPKVCFVIRMFGIIECYISEWNTTLMGCVYIHMISRRLCGLSTWIIDRNCPKVQQLH